MSTWDPPTAALLGSGRELARGSASLARVAQGRTGLRLPACLNIRGEDGEGPSGWRAGTSVKPPRHVLLGSRALVVSDDGGGMA